MFERMNWHQQVLSEMEALSGEISKWQSELKKDTLSWRGEMLREKNSWKSETLKEWDRLIKEEVKPWHQAMAGEVKNWKQVIQKEIQQMKGENIYGDQESAGKGTGTEDILGSAVGEGDQAKTDDTSGRKGRSRPTGTK